jgi:hypothetical protein
VESGRCSEREDKKGDEINRLKIALDALFDKLWVTEEQRTVAATAVHEVERALSDKETKLVKLAGELDGQSTFVDAQKIEIIALKTQVEVLKEGRRDAEQFHLRVAELLQQLIAQATEGRSSAALPRLI